MSNTYAFEGKQFILSKFMTKHWKYFCPIQECTRSQMKLSNLILLYMYQHNEITI